MNDSVKLMILFVVLIGAVCGYTLPIIFEKYYLYKEKELKENLSFQYKMECLQQEQIKENIKLRIEEEQTKQKQIKLAQKLAEKDKAVEYTKQLQIKADYKKKNGTELK